jgi:hypothetical protein
VNVAPLPDSAALLQQIEDLSWQMAAHSTGRAHLPSNSRDTPSAPGTAIRAAAAPPEMKLPPPSAGTIAATEPGCKSVFSPVPTTSRETNAANINDDTCLLYKHSRLFFTYRLSKRKFLVDPGFRPLRVTP